MRSRGEPKCWEFSGSAMSAADFADQLRGVVRLEQAVDTIGGIKLPLRLARQRLDHQDCRLQTRPGIPAYTVTHLESLSHPSTPGTSCRDALNHFITPYALTIADAEKLRHVALVCVENGKYTTSEVFFEP
jgi:hypothetical protein